MTGPIEGEVLTPGLPARRYVGEPVPTFTPQHVIDRTILHEDEIAEISMEGLSETTWRRYRVAIRDYLRWCRENGRTPNPATLETLLSYLHDLIRRGFAASTLRVHLAAIKRLHGYGDDPDGYVGGHQRIADLIEGYERRRAKDPATAPKRAMGARVGQMRLLMDTCDPATVTGKRDRCALALIYHMAARRSEVCNLRIPHIRWIDEGLEAFVAYSKTDQTGADAGWVAVPSNDKHPEFCPARATAGWMRVQDELGIAATGPLLLPIDRYGNIRPQNEPMSGTAFQILWDRALDRARAQAKAHAEATGDERSLRLLTGRLVPHSARRGFATDAREADWDLLDISRHGRWSPQSRVVQLYIEEADKWRRHRLKPVRL